MLFLFLSCVRLSPYLSDPLQNPHPDCASGSHYKAIGQGESPQQAVSDAHRQISEQVSSSIQAESELIKTYVELNVRSKEKLENSSEYSSALRSQILTRTQFKHN